MTVAWQRALAMSPFALTVFQLVSIIPLWKVWFWIINIIIIKVFLPHFVQDTEVSTIFSSVIAPIIWLQYLGGRVQVNHYGGGEHAGELPPPSYTSLQAGPGDMRASSPGKDTHSPIHSNRNSAASSDSGRGISTGHLEPKVGHLSCSFYQCSKLVEKLPVRNLTLFIFRGTSACVVHSCHFWEYHIHVKNILNTM